MKPVLSMFLICGVLVGCGEPSRDRAVERISDTVCDRFDQCGDLGRYDYATYSECLSDIETRFYDGWPDDQCGEGQINRDRFLDCEDRAANYPCQANLGDFISFLSNCNAQQVCIDPRD